MNSKYRISEGNRQLKSPKKTFSATMLSSLLAVAKIGFFWVRLVVCFFGKVSKEHWQFAERYLPGSTSFQAQTHAALVAHILYIIKSLYNRTVTMVMEAIGE